jgi:hypothetical protein
VALDQVRDETPRPAEPNRTVRVTFNIPLTDFTWANGSTEFIPGSHAQSYDFNDQSFLDVPNVYSVQTGPPARGRDPPRRAHAAPRRPQPHRCPARHARPDLPDGEGSAGVTPRSVSIDLSGIGVRVRGLSPGLADALHDAWAGFLVDDVAEAALTVEVEDDSAVLSSGGGLGASRLHLHGDDVHVARQEGGARIDAVAGLARVRLATGDERRRAWGLVNIVNAALAFVLERSGGGILHAAGILLDGRVFVLVGAEGAGKTTFARVASEAGVPVLSDDQIVIVPAGGRCDAVAAPIRNRDFPTPGRGRWPIGAFLLPAHGTPAALAPASRIDLTARLAANLLYVSLTPFSGGESSGWPTSLRPVG